MRTITVAIIIVNYNSADETLRCLESLDLHYADAKKKNTDAADRGFSFSVTVVDNGSRDGSADRLLAEQDSFSFPVEVLINENTGFGGGNNTAIRKICCESRKSQLSKRKSQTAVPDYFLLLNPDTIINESDFLEKLIETAGKHPRAAAVGPMIYQYYGDHNDNDEKKKDNELFFAGGRIEAAGARGIHVGLGEHDVGQYGATPYKTEFVTGACMLIPRRAVEHLGLLEEDYFLYYEDVDWCLRARQEGWQCLVDPRAHIWHEVSVTTEAGSFAYVYYHVRNGFVLGWRYGCRFCVLVRGMAVAAKQGLKFSVPGKRMWARATLRGLWDASRGRMGPI